MALALAPALAGWEMCHQNQVSSAQKANKSFGLADLAP